MIKFEKLLITPERAEAYLKLNTQNRRVKKHVVQRYARDIETGRWKEDTGEVIKITTSGLILDGQHRLHAIVKAGKSVWMHVATGINSSVFDVLDSGSPRTAGDVFKTSGVKNEMAIPSIISMYERVQSARQSEFKKAYRNTPAELLAKYQQDEEFWQYIAKRAQAGYYSFSRVVAPSVLGGILALIIKVDAEKAERFYTQLVTGENVDNNIIFTLRKKLINDQMSSKKLPLPDKIALIIKAWNVYHKGRTVNTLTFNPAKESYPRVAV